ncbi:acetyltransferase [Bythopirellula goksoeyrii]|uniref:Acetyltransferase EpsM n=1 Tax=Bythopirellula goksoeyrii TaxID=1400387 RepID=A0A5B9QEW3_9BACT|nr:acetyltransferase [Bythopirellula goksoeyrii]QEG36180.1 Putative acetyltransferase EpsM [Bythopirellula goksoeyrii]
MTKQPEEIFVIGGGGHGKVAVRAAQAAGKRVAAIFDDDPGKWNCVLYGVPVMGPLDALRRRNVLPTLVAIGDNNRRLALVEKWNLPWTSVVHPAAFVDDSAQIGAGVLILPGAVVHTDAVVGDHTIVNSNATIEHDCQIGPGAHISCSACLTGGVQVGCGVMIGAGAIVLPGVLMSDFAVVGAGSVVTRNVPAATTVAGVPARNLNPRKRSDA